jgi:hypothetical protein
MTNLLMMDWLNIDWIVNLITYVIYLCRKVVCFVVMRSTELGCFRLCVLGVFEKLSMRRGAFGLVPWHLDLWCKGCWILNDFYTLAITYPLVDTCCILFTVVTDLSEWARLQEWIIALLRLIWKDIKIFQTQQRENNWKTFGLPCGCSGWRQREDHQACSSNLHRLLQGDWMLSLVFLTNCANKKSRLFKDNPLFAQGRKNKSRYKQWRFENKETNGNTWG